jgi:hypothetical protein
MPVILESNFREEYDAPLLRRLVEKTGSKCLQINCGADGEILIQRFKDRESKPERSYFHFPGNIDEFAAVLKKGFDPPLSLPGEVLTIDTSDFEKVDLKAIAYSVKNF